MKKKVFLRLRLTGIHGHMVKAQNEIKDSLKLIDIVVEVLDARIPFSSQNPIINNMIIPISKMPTAKLHFFVFVICFSSFIS